MNRLDGAPTLPIKDDTDQAVDALARELYRTYDITPEQAQQMARSRVMQSLDAQDMSGQPTVALSLAEMHRDAGASPADAYRLGANQVATYGPAGAAGLYQEYQTPEGMARLVQAQSENRAANARHQQMYDDYFTATGAPSHQSPSPTLQRQWDDSERYAREQGRIIRAGLHPQTPVDPGTPAQQASWEEFVTSNPDEMQRWRPEEYALQQAEKRKEEMEAAFVHIRQRYGPDEEQKARAAYEKGSTYVPHTAHQNSMNATRRANEDAAMRGDDTARKALREQDKRVRDARDPQIRRRLMAQSGLDPATASRYSDDQLRDVIASNRAQDARDRELQWRPRTMIQAGNAIGALALPGLDPGQQAAILGGARPLDVEAMGVRNALRMLEGMNLAQGMFQNNPVAQQQVADAQAKRDADIVADAEKYINDNFAWDQSGFWGSFASDFSEAEQEQAALYLSQKHRIPLERAKVIVSAIAARKRKTAPAAPPPGDDGSADPGDLPTTTW